MKGFQIHYKDKVSNVAVPDGIITINIFQQIEDARLDVQSVDYSSSNRNIWYNSFPIEIGDVINIQVKEINEPSHPDMIIKGEVIKRPKAKLEIFREIEENLNRKGLL